MVDKVERQTESLDYFLLLLAAVFSLRPKILIMHPLLKMFEHGSSILEYFIQSQ